MHFFHTSETHQSAKRTFGAAAQMALGQQARLPKPFIAIFWLFVDQPESNDFSEGKHR